MLLRLLQYILGIPCLLTCALVFFKKKEYIKIRLLFFKYFKYIFWDVKKFPKVDNRFPILDIYKCPFSESGSRLLKMAKNETIKKVMVWSQKK
jgi:hypothetical protein